MTYRAFLRSKILHFLDEAREPQQQLLGLVPVDGENQVKSNFEADAPRMRAFANSSPDNLAQVLIFVLITPRAKLTAVYASMPIIVAILKKMGGDEITRDRLEAEIMRNTESGITIRNTVNGYKIGGICALWNRRAEIFARVQQFTSAGDEDVVSLMDFLATLPGIDVVKAAFACQCILGKLGCIDVHNHLIFTSYFRHTNSPQAAAKKVQQMDLKNFSGSGKGQEARVAAIQRYLKVLGMLEKEGFGTKQLWDVWTTFVANLSDNKQGDNLYNTDLGTGVDPHNLQKFKGLEVKRMGRNIPIAAHPAGRGVGLAHDLAGRQPQDLLGPAMDIADAPRPGVRAQKYPGFQAMSPRTIDKAPVDKLLIWVARDPEMAEKLGVSPEQMRDLRRLLKARGIGE